MKKVFMASIALACSIVANSQQKADSLKVVQLEDVVISATRVGADAPVAFSNLNEAEIKKDNAAKNIPALLNILPSVVSYTEGGTAVGNTSFRIRGTDANRINITLNGMPLNNAETQEVYWVNLPDLSNSLQSMQIQRGVGTSTNGTASFGASISMQTLGGQPKPYADLSASYGQYNTMLLTAAAGTGIMKNGLSLDARYSYVKSDGYIRNGKVDHKNIYAALSHYTDKQLIRLIYMNGIQHTGITWEGIDPSKVATDRRYNGAGKYEDENGKEQYYDNETDNYYSNIGQLLYTRYLTTNLTLNANLSYNHGYGYYENYKTDQKFGEKFGLPNQIVNGVEYKKSDIIRRKLLMNHLYTGGFNLNFKKEKIGLTVGGVYNYFDGEHYGHLLWAKYNQDIPKGYEWFRNEADKKDMNAFLKAEYRPLDNLSLFAEVQDRYVDYRMKGIDDDLTDLTNNNYYNFINPKGGVSLRFAKYNEVYGSFGISNREPLRADLKESLKGGGSRSITSERLYDYELGYRYANPVFSLSVNYYYMKYNDQLVLTGKLNDTGYKLQENVPDSYRTGVEIAMAYAPTEWLRVDGNVTISRNKIKNYTAYYDYYDTDWNYLGQVSEFHKSTDISFSPNLVGSGIVTFKPFEKEVLTLSFINKYVGKMYYDNTSDPDKRLQDHLVTDMVLSYTLKPAKIGTFDFQFYINNMMSIKYNANAGTETSVFSDGSRGVYKWVYPQAGANLMGKIRYRF